MSSISTITEAERENILDLLASDKNMNDIAKELCTTKNKLTRKIQQIALILYKDDTDMDDIVNVTRISEAKLKRLLDEQALKLNYERNNTITSMLASIDKKQTEILHLQQRLVTMMNESWKY